MFNIRSAMCVPLLNKQGRMIGCLYVDNRIQSDCFEDDDLRLLSAFADQASIAIENAKLYEKIRHETNVRNNLSRYLSPDLVERLINERSSGAILGGERVEATVLFADIRGFTTFSEKWPSKDVITFLNEYLSRMTRIIFQYKGTLDKYIGDGIMAVFGAPFNPDYAPARAVMAALHMQSEMKSLHKRWAEMGYPPMQIGIGINTGEVTAGNIGFRDEDNDARSRLDFTVIGDAVNTAARLESIAPGGSILISQATCDQISDRFTVKAEGEKNVKGKSKAVRVYRVTGVKR
jgi:adenylate cyclase